MTKLTKNDLKNDLKNLDTDLLGGLDLNTVIDKMSEGDLSWLASTREKEAKAYKAHHGKLAHPMEMSLWYMANRSAHDFDLSQEDLDIFEATIFKVSQKDFGNFKFELPSGASPKLKFAMMCLKSVSERSMMELQQDAFSYFFEHSEVFAQLSEAEADGVDLDAH